MNQGPAIQNHEKGASLIAINQSAISQELSKVDKPIESEYLVKFRQSVLQQDKDYIS